MAHLVRLSVLAVICSTLLAACASNITIEYSPKTTAEVKGVVAVNDFKYMRSSGTDENELQCSSCVRGFHLTESVSDYVTNAVKREFRQAGISLKKSRCSLDGEINKLSYSIVPFSDDTFKSDIRYILSDSNGKALYDNDYKVEFDAARMNVNNSNLWFNNLNKALSNNIDKLLNDSNFASIVQGHCQ